MPLFRPLVLSIAVVAVAAVEARAQILRLAELNTTQIAALDRSRTVVILTGGIMEEHGPYLPSFSDGYVNEFATQRLAEAIVARPGWQVLLFPMIPLGTGGANVLGSKQVFPGTYAVRSNTLRAVFMDLATEFGEQGFKWIFVVHAHGAAHHNRALHQAGDYFRDTYGGRMVNIMGLTAPNDPGEPPDAHPLTEAELKEDGLSIHGGAFETSGILFLRPDLVGAFAEATPQTGTSFKELAEVARRPGWPGYFGSPRLATAARGTRWSLYIKVQTDYALAILDGADERQSQRIGMKIGDDIEREALAYEAAQEQKQQAWVQAHPPK